MGSRIPRTVFEAKRGLLSEGSRKCEQSQTTWNRVVLWRREKIESWKPINRHHLFTKVHSAAFRLLNQNWNVRGYETSKVRTHSVNTNMFMSFDVRGVITVSYSLWSRQFRETVASQLLKPVLLFFRSLNTRHFKDAFCLMPIISAITLDRKNVTNSDTSPDCRNKNRRPALRVRREWQFRAVRSRGVVMTREDCILDGFTWKL